METKIYEGIFKSLDETGHGVARIATLGVVDADGDVLRAGLLGGTQTVPLLVSHDWSRLALGKATVEESGDELLARFRINMAMGRGRELHAALKFDLDTPPPRQNWSFGFRILPDGSGTQTLADGRRIREIRRIEMLEVSPVVRGASVNTATLAMKSEEDLAAQTAAVVAEYERIQQRGAAYLAKLAGQVSYRYIDMTGFTLQDPRRHLAREALFFASKELGVPPPALKFITTSDPERAEFVSEKMWGYSRKGDHIAVEWTLSPVEMMQVVAHEVGHAAGLDEEAAGEFGKSFASRNAKLLGPTPRPGGHWSYEQAAAVAQWMRYQGVRM